MNGSTLFHNVFENNFVRILLTVSPMLLILSMLLAHGIIWFERFGTDQKRTIINKLVSHGLYIIIISLPLIVLSDIIRYLVGPLPAKFCFFQVIFKGATFTQILCYFDAIIVAKYALIFWTKNPASLNHDFWSRFISIWIYIVSLTTSFTRYTFIFIKKLNQNV
jgi:hypothetical protein